MLKLILPLLLMLVAFNAFAYDDDDSDGIPNIQDSCVYHADCDTLLASDLNGDFIITSTDFLILRAGFFSDDLAGDINGDGFVTITDFLILRSNFHNVYLGCRTFDRGDYYQVFCWGLTNDVLNWEESCHNITTSTDMALVDCRFDKAEYGELD